jgi:outer membrane protein assembly factor BamB
MTKRCLAFVFALLLLVPLIAFPSTNAASTNNWSMLQHDAAHSGYSNTTLQGTPISIWNFSGKSTLSSVVVSNGVAYFTSGGFIQNEIYAVNASTGQLIWNNSYYKPSSGAMPCPAVDDGVVYTTTTGYNASNGNLLFNYTNVNASTSPTVANSLVYFGTNSSNFFAPGGVVALNGKTGQEVWSFTGEQGQFMYGGMVQYPPAVETGIVYFSSGGGVYALNAAYGDLLWHNSAIDKGWGSLGCISVSEGRIYDNVAGTLICMGHSSWTAAVGGGGNEFAAIANGTVFLNSCALDASTGKVIWNNSLTGLSSPVLADGIVFYGHYWYSDEGSHGRYNKHGMIGCNATTGEIVWNYTLPDFYDSQSGGYISIGNGMLFYSDSSTVYAFNLAPTPVQPVSQSTATKDSLFIVTLTVIVIVGIATIILIAKKRQKKPKT